MGDNRAHRREATFNRNRSKNSLGKQDQTVWTGKGDPLDYIVFRTDLKDDLKILDENALAYVEGDPKFLEKMHKIDSLQVNHDEILLASKDQVRPALEKRWKEELLPIELEENPFTLYNEACQFFPNLNVTHYPATLAEEHPDAEIYAGLQAGDDEHRLTVEKELEIVNAIIARDMQSIIDNLTADQVLTYMTSAQKVNYKKTCVDMTVQWDKVQKIGYNDMKNKVNKLFGAKFDKEMYSSVPGFSEAMTERNAPLAYKLINTHYQRSNLTTAATVENLIQSLSPSSKESLQEIFSRFRHQMERYATIVGQTVDEANPDDITWPETAEINDNVGSKLSDEDIKTAHGRVLIPNAKKFTWLDAIIRRHPLHTYDNVWQGFSKLPTSKKSYTELCDQLTNLEQDNQQIARLAQEKRRAIDMQKGEHHRGRSDRTDSSYSNRERNRSISRDRDTYRANYVDRQNPSEPRHKNRNRDRRDRSRSRDNNHRYRSSQKIESSYPDRRESPMNNFPAGEREMRREGVDRLKATIGRNKANYTTRDTYQETEQSSEANSSDTSDSDQSLADYNRRYKRSHNIELNSGRSPSPRTNKPSAAQRAIWRVKSEIGDRVVKGFWDRVKEAQYDIEEEDRREVEKVYSSHHRVAEYNNKSNHRESERKRQSASY
jgi:hypothetical protein